ncbi:hypothetical protein C874_18195 [Elizabethkingia anophelis 502]|nr:hypothetical protein C874_18195 [Elizabethkingia anophelis 502]
MIRLFLYIKLMCDARVHYVVEETNEIGNLQKNIGEGAILQII